MGKKKTLCKWSKRDIREDFNRLREIVEQPRYACRDCGRAANKKKHLCEPKSLG